jgi:hypothetical protein
VPVESDVCMYSETRLLVRHSFDPTIYMTPSFITNRSSSRRHLHRLTLPTQQQRGLRTRRFFGRSRLYARARSPPPLVPCTCACAPYSVEICSAQDVSHGIRYLKTEKKAIKWLLVSSGSYISAVETVGESEGLDDD